MILALYRLITDAVAWPLRLWLRVRALRHKEDANRLKERLGQPGHARPNGKLVWCHGASVGESLVLLPLAESFCADPDTHVLITTGTKSSADLLSDRLPPKAVHQYAPWDRRAWVNRFLDHWTPDLAVRAESELWPNTVFALRDRSIPIAVVNGRLSDGSINRWSRFPAAAHAVYDSLTLVLAQTDPFAKAFRNLGAPKVHCVPNLKLSAPALPVTDTGLTDLRQQIGNRPVWLAASTHDGEEEVALNVHKGIKDELTDLLTIIVPRHPHRSEAIVQLVKQNNLNASERSSGNGMTLETDVYVADTFGELGLFFHIAPVVFMGKSLTAHGGQNPIEPAHFDCAILFGPFMENFEDLAEIMIKEGMAIQITGGEDLRGVVRSLLTDHQQRQRLADSAKKIIAMGDDSLETTFSALQTLMNESA